MDFESSLVLFFISYCDVFANTFRALSPIALKTTSTVGLIAFKVSNFKKKHTLSFYLTRKLFLKILNNSSMYLTEINYRTKLFSLFLTAKLELMSGSQIEKDLIKSLWPIESFYLLSQSLVIPLALAFTISFNYFVLCFFWHKSPLLTYSATKT